MNTRSMRSRTTNPTVSTAEIGTAAGTLVVAIALLVLTTGTPLQAQEEETVAGQAPESVHQEQSLNPKVATVNGEPVLAAEVTILLKSMIAQSGHQGDPTEEMVQAALKRVIETRLLAQEAARLELKADPQRVAQRMAAIEQQAGGRDRLVANLAAGGTTIDTIETSVREMELVRELINTQIRPTIEVTDEEIQELYTDKPEAFTSTESVHARHIIFAVQQGSDQATVEAARVKAEAARKRALAGEDFPALATELSEGPSAPRGGDLGFFTAEQMVPEFAEAAFALEPGAISEVVRTGFGFHVIKVEERREGGELAPLEQVREQIVTVLKQGKASERLSELLTELLEKADIQTEEGTNLPPALQGVAGATG